MWSTDAPAPVYGMVSAMQVTIDKAGRLVIPRPLRERIGLVGGGTVDIDIDGSDLRIRPVAGSRLREEGDLLIIPRAGVAIDDTRVHELIDADRYRD
jgi:AbrB family looped-hinge helix DNA binding protein